MFTRLIPVSLALASVLAVLPGASACAQRREPPRERPWLFEGEYRQAILLDDPVVYIGARFGRELWSGFSVALAGALMITDQAETRSVSGFERFNSLVFLGPSLELSDTILISAASYRLSNMRWLLRVGFVGGLVDREVGDSGGISDRTELLTAVDPEVGILFHFGRVGITGTVGVIYGRLVGPREELYSAPTGTLGLRFMW